MTDTEITYHVDSLLWKLDAVPYRVRENRPMPIWDAMFQLMYKDARNFPFPGQRTYWPDGGLRIRSSVSFGAASACHRTLEVVVGAMRTNRWTACHELAHLLTIRQSPDHGPDFQEMYHHVLSRHVSPELADAYQAMFRTMRASFPSPVAA